MNLLGAVIDNEDSDIQVRQMVLVAHGYIDILLRIPLCLQTQPHMRVFPTDITNAMPGG